MEDKGIRQENAIVPDALMHTLAAASEVFGVSVKASDNFLDLGGDSILVAQLAVELEQRLGLGNLDVDVALIVDTPDFTALAESLAALVRSRAALEPGSPVNANTDPREEK